MRTKKILFLMGYIVSGCAILILFFSLVLYFVLLLPPVQRYILTVAKPFYENVFYGKTSIGAIKSNLMSYAIIENVEIRDNVHYENKITIDHVKIDFWSPSLFFKKVVVNSITANSVSVCMAIPKNHKFSFPAMPRSNAAAENGTKSPWKVELGAVKIKKTNIEYKDSSGGVFASIKDAVIEADFYRTDSFFLSVNGYKNSVTAPWWSGRIDTLVVASVIKPKWANIKSFTLKGPTLLLQVNGRLPFVITDRFDLNGHVRADLKSFSSANVSSKWKTRGVVTVDAHWGGSFLKPILHIYADGNKIKLEKILVNSINMDCEYKNSLLSLITHAQSGDLKAVLTGESEISGLFSNPQLGKYTAKIALEGQTVSALKFINSGITTIKTGMLTASAGASGEGLGIPDNCTANVIIENKDKNNLITHLVLNKHLWKLDGTWEDNKISGEGVLGEKLQLTGKVKLNFPEVQPVALALLDQKISGKIRSDLTFSGVLPSLNIKSELHCENIKWNKLTLSTLSGKINYTDKILNVESVDASISGESNGILRMINVDSCGGMVHLDVKASGTLPDLNADVILQGTGIYYKQIVARKVFADLNVNAMNLINLRSIVIENDKSKMTASGLVVLKPEMEINLNAETEIKAGLSNWNSAGGVQINVKATNKNIKSTISTSGLNVGILNQWYPLPYNISGLLTSKLEINGSPLNPLLKAQIELNEAAFNNVKIRNVRGSVNIIDSVVNSRFLISISDTISHVQVDATIPMRPKQNWTIDLSGNRKRMITITSDTLNIEDVVLSKGGDFSMHGPVFGQLMIKGDDAIWRLDGNVKLLGNEFYYEPYNVNVKSLIADFRIQGSSDKPDISVNYSSGETNINSQIITRTRLNGRLEGKTIFIDSASLGINNRDALMISGQIPLSTIDPLLSKSEFAIRYKMVALPLKLLEIIAPNIYITGGVVDGNGTVFITNGKLRSDGLLSLTNGIFETEFLDQKIGPVKGNLVFKSDSIVLENWTGVIEKGSFNLGGKGILLPDGTLGLSLTLKGKNIDLDASDIVKLQVQKVDLQLRNGIQKRHYILDGKINFGPTRFIRDVQINDIVALSKPQEELVDTKSIFDSIDLRIELQFQDNLYVDMNLGDMQLEGDVVVTGVASKPAFAGEINVVQGKVFYLDRKFDINKGNINFVSPTEFNPSIYVDAKTEVNTFAQGTTQNVTYYITLIVSGTLEHPVVSLTSDPPLDEPNVVSVLTLGTTMGSLGSDIASRIGSMVGNKFLGFGTKSLERLLGLESISVSGNIFDAKDTLNGPQLSVTKRLSDRLILSYESTFGASNQQKISILYRLFPFLFLTGQTETSGDSRLILKFRINR